MDKKLTYEDVFIDEYMMRENQDIYPFTTEMISGYLKFFKLKNKSLLTVGSSGDQVINAIIKGANDITLLDWQPYARYYYFLKIASMLSLDMDDFLLFLRYENYRKVFHTNMKVFQRKVFNKVKPTLKELDYDSYAFWDMIFKETETWKLRMAMFDRADEGREETLAKANLYMRDEKHYILTKKKITSVIPKFIVDDVYKVELNRTYDNIWLSNIGTYATDIQIFKGMVDKMANHLTDDGRLLLCYLYNTPKFSKHLKGEKSIYDLKGMRELFSEYDIRYRGFENFYLSWRREDKDAILIYKK